MSIYDSLAAYLMHSHLERNSFFLVYRCSLSVIFNITWLRLPLRIFVILGFGLRINWYLWSYGSNFFARLKSLLSLSLSEPNMSRFILSSGYEFTDEASSHYVIGSWLPVTFSWIWSFSVRLDYCICWALRLNILKNLPS